jgi:integrase
MPRRAKGISAAKVMKAKPGRYGDGGGLYLLVRSETAKFWSFRYVRAGKMREIGLGPAAGRTAVTLADARKKARDLWDIHKAGGDPLTDQAVGRSAANAAAAKAVTFQQAALDFIEANRIGWRNAVHAGQWETTLATYAYPKIGSLCVSDIDTGHVVSVLQPIWNSKPETASRLRGRIEKILGREKALKHRDGANPAAWKENIDAILPRRSKVQRVKHHAAMPAKEVGDFMAKLRADPGTLARALEFCILTCTRTAETLGARWAEIDLDEKIWIIPAARIKGGREHRVALSSRAIAILKEMQRHRADSDLVFPGRSKGGSLSRMVLRVQLRRIQSRGSYTVHGFRSTFRDWVSDSTNFSSEVAELALAHIVSDETERAYRRGDALQKRFQLAEAWAEFCSRPSRKDDAGKVVGIRGGSV